MEIDQYFEEEDEGIQEVELGASAKWLSAYDGLKVDWGNVPDK